MAQEAEPTAEVRLCFLIFYFTHAPLLTQLFSFVQQTTADETSNDDAAATTTETSAEPAATETNADSTVANDVAEDK